MAFQLPASRGMGNDAGVCAGDVNSCFKTSTSKYICILPLLRLL